MPELPSGGAVRPITRWGDPVMHAPCRPVEDFDEYLTELVADLVATMRIAEGVGLAANQVGVGLQVFVFDCPDDDGVPHAGVVCNPQLVVPTGGDRNLDESDEGCLSLPGAFATCARPDYAEVTGVDHTGAPVKHAGNGYLARCLQHETDHVVGIVFGDRLANRSRKKLYKEAEQAADQFPLDWPANL